MTSINKRWLRFPSLVKNAKSMEYSYEEFGSTFKIATSFDELCHSYRLIYDQYRDAGYIRQKDCELFFTKYHVVPDTTVLIAKSEANVVATASVIYDSKLFGLPIDSMYPDEMNSLRNRGRKILEISSFASTMSKKWQGISMNFMRLTFLYCTFQDVDDICIMINPKHIDFYLKSSPFKIFGTEKYYSKVDAPAIALRADVQQIKDFYAQSKLMFSIKDQINSHYHSLKISLSCNILEEMFSRYDEKNTAKNPLNGTDIKKLLQADPELANQLSSLEVQKYLQTVYPDFQFD